MRTKLALELLQSRESSISPSSCVTDNFAKENISKTNYAFLINVDLNYSKADKLLVPEHFLRIRNVNSHLSKRRLGQLFYVFVTGNFVQS